MQFDRRNEIECIFITLAVQAERIGAVLCVPDSDGDLVPFEVTPQGRIAAEQWLAQHKR